MSQSISNSGDSSPSVPQDAEYPPQRHAGAVGLGPEFGKGASINDKFSGLKHEIMGKLKHDPNLVEHGQDLRTGELKRKELKQDLGAFGQSDQTHPDGDKHQAEDACRERSDTIEHPEDKQ